MELRPVVISGGMVSIPLLIPLVVGFAIAGHPDISRGILLGALIGLLNSLLLARKLDRVITGREAWQSLKRTMPRNMAMRFSLIFGLCALATQVRGINVAGMAGGLALCIGVHVIYSGWAVRERWKKEDGTLSWVR